MDEHLKGPSAFAFGYSDPVAPARIVNDFIKKYKKMSVKAGLVDNKLIDENGVKALAALPAREVMVAKMLGGMNAPVSRLVTVLGGQVRALVYTLGAIREKRRRPESRSHFIRRKQQWIKIKLSKRLKT